MRRAIHRLCSFVVFVIAAAASNSAFASHTFCVTSSGGTGSAAQLLTALNYYDSAADETVYIHLEQGIFTLPGYQAFDAYQNASLHLVGGFVPGTSCQQRVIDPTKTVIKGAPGDGPSELLITQTQGELLIDDVTFFAFAQGVAVWTFSDSTLTLRNIEVTGNSNVEGYGKGALTVETRGASGSSAVRIENCLIDNNSAPAGLNILTEHAGDSIQVLGCTIVDNDNYGLILGESVAPLEGTFSAYDNIIRGNLAADIYALDVVNVPMISYSDFNSVSGPLLMSHNVNVDPKFTGTGAHAYDLKIDSPVINIGASASTVASQTGQKSFAYADTDLRGRKRVIGSHIDMGAYESLIDDTVPQPVESISDSPTGMTLRAAIATANADANPTTITFNITAACPQVIDLGSLLPDITTDVTIDGYTQPGASPNTIVPGYNGSICIVLRGGGLDHAFKTSGSGRLTVRGIEFENFSTAAVRLSSGSDHVVTGNGFSAFGGSTANKDGVLIEGAAASSQIGSFAFGDRNVFAQATDAAIKLSSNGIGNHVIQGNYVGFNFDGTAWTGAQNKYGIYLLDSGSNSISYNFIGGSQLSAIYLTGAGTSANRIIENSIGSAPANDAVAGGGAGTCNPFCFGGFAAVDLVASAHDNYVGALGGSGGTNYIANNYGPGVEVESNAGTGNRVYGNNLIHDNSGYLAIDLSTQGPTANDSGDGDSGGNNTQNYPILSQALRIEADSIRVGGLMLTQNFGPAQTYRLDFYWTDTCVAGDASGPRGELKKYVGYFNLYADGTSTLVPFSLTDIVAAVGLPSTGYLSAIATDGYGNTSEPGPCHAYTDDHIFANGF